MPADSRAATFSGLLVMRRTWVTPSSLRTSAGSSYARQSAAIAQLDVGFDGVHALVLQFVGFELGHQADAAALLLLVEQNAGACWAILLRASSSCKTAVAAQRAEDVAGEALRVNADERRSGVDVAHDQRDEAFDLSGLTARRFRSRGAGLGACPQSQECGSRPSVWGNPPQRSSLRFQRP